MSILHMTIHSQSMAFLKKNNEKRYRTATHMHNSLWGNIAFFGSAGTPPPKKKKEPKKRFVWPKRIWVTFKRDCASGWPKYR